MEKKWEEMSPDEKRQELFQRWLSPPVEFASPQAEKAYKERVTRIKDAIELKKLPDRVPVVPFAGDWYPAYYCGLTPRDVMYDYEKLNMANKKYVLDFEPDAHYGTPFPAPGKVFDILDYKLYLWPGHGVPPHLPHQCVEGEYMKADEYDALIQDPSYFFTSIYLPRIFGALEPFKKLAPLTYILEMPGPFSAVYLIPYGLPDVQDALKALQEAGSEALKWIGFVAAHGGEMIAAGFPGITAAATKGPFDAVADTLRGIRQTMMDIYRRPDKLLKAIEVMTPFLIKKGASEAKAGGIPTVFIPLHNGADGFLSDEHFKKFYWPGLRDFIMGLIHEGCVPFLFAEGGYNTRLEVIRDLPRGKVVWYFDRTDMAKAKEMLGDVSCIAGNVPAELLCTGTPDEVKDYARRVIDVAGKGGGYILASGSVIHEARPENIKAMIEAAKKYGVYK